MDVNCPPIRVKFKLSVSGDGYRQLLLSAWYAWATQTISSNRKTRSSAITGLFCSVDCSEDVPRRIPEIESPLAVVQAAPHNDGIVGLCSRRDDDSIRGGRDAVIRLDRLQHFSRQIPPIETLFAVVEAAPHDHGVDPLECPNERIRRYWSRVKGGPFLGITNANLQMDILVAIFQRGYCRERERTVTRE